MGQWTTNDMPDLHGRTALVTGANSGLGLETTRALAAKGARVIMACRNMEKGQIAQAEVAASVSGAQLELAQLDLASQASVREFAASFQQTHERLDLLLIMPVLWRFLVVRQSMALKRNSALTIWDISP